MRRNPLEKVVPRRERVEVAQLEHAAGGGSSLALTDQGLRILRRLETSPAMPQRQSNWRRRRHVLRR